MSKPLVIGFPQSTYVWTSRAALARKGVDYDFQPIAPGQNRTPEHLAMHPWGKVPVFKHDDVTLIETTAVCSYVDTAFEGPALQPSDPVALARTHQWVSIANSYLYPSGIARFALQFIFPRGENGAPDMATIEAAKPDIRKTLEVINAGVGASGWLVGDTATLADYFVGPLFFSIAPFPGGAALFTGLDGVGRLREQLMADAAFMSGAPPMKG